MKKLIVVADWVADSLTCQEFRTAVEGFVQNPDKLVISYVASTPRTIHTGFLINQIVEIEERFGHPLQTVIFQNTDPRLASHEREIEAKGAPFFIIRLKSGIILCGPNAGYDFSFIKSRIEEVFVYPGLDKGTQFRSRDLYARVCSHLMDELIDELNLEETSIGLIPTIKGFYIGHIDNFGNIKTTITKENLKGRYEFGDELLVKINKVQKKVKYVASLFGGRVGQPVIYPGSSGERDNPYLEISVWRHFDQEDWVTGSKLFQDPLPGTAIEI